MSTPARTRTKMGTIECALQALCLVTGSQRGPSRFELCRARTSLRGLIGNRGQCCAWIACPTRADTNRSRDSQAQLEADIKRELVSDSNLLKFIHQRRLISRGLNHGQAHRGVVLPVSFCAKQSQGFARGTDRVSTRPQESTEERVRRLSLKATGFDRFKGRLDFFEGPAYKQERAIVSQWLPKIVQVLRSLTGIQWRALQNPKSQGSSSTTAAEAIMKGLGELQKLAKGSSTGITEDKLVCDFMHVRGDKAIES